MHDITIYLPTEMSLHKSLYFSADLEKEPLEKTVTVTSDGMVTWTTSVIFKSTCQVEMWNFPFDTQTCMLIFQANLHDGLVMMSSGEHIDLANYYPGYDWELLDTDVKSARYFYECCPDEPFTYLRFYITMKRQATFYMYVLILPSILLSLMSLMLYWMPSEGPDRAAFGE